MTPGQIMAREARVLQLRLEFGLASLEEVELWADAWLLAFDKPPEALTDLAFASKGHVLDALSLLRSLEHGSLKAHEVVQALAVAKSSELSLADLESIARKVSNFAVELEEDSVEGKLLYQAYEVWDCFNPMETGRAAESRQRAKAQSFFDKVADRAREISAGGAA